MHEVLDQLIFLNLQESRIVMLELKKQIAKLEERELLAKKLKKKPK